MPAQIPHTFRKSSGIYYIRYVLPLAVRQQLPGCGGDACASCLFGIVPSV